MTIRATSKPDNTFRAFALTVGTRSFAICLCVLLGALWSSSSLKAAERAIGHVLDVEGQWYLDGRPGRALSRGDELPASGVIRIPSPTRYAFIVIRYSDNSQIIRRRCGNPGECDPPILLPKAVQRETSIAEIFLDTFFAAFRRRPVTGSSNAGRSSDGTLREAVVQIRNGQVDLAPIFTEMNNGTYNVRVRKRMPDGKMADAGSENSIKVRWDSSTVTTTPATNLQPGIYELVLLESRGAELRPTLTTAWFLAGNLEQYAQTVGPFCEATHLTATWKNDVSEGTVKDFLGSFLIQLSESQSAQPAR